MDYAVSDHQINMNHHIKFLLVIFVVTIGCTNNSMNHLKNEITKVSFANESPYITIEIDSSMNYKYYGDERAKNKGYYTGKLSEADWTQLTDLLERVGYNQLDTVVELKIDDVGVELVVQGRNSERHYSGSLVNNDSFHKAYEWFIQSVDRVKLKRSQDTLKFEMRRPYPPTPVNPKFPPTSLN